MKKILIGGLVIGASITAFAADAHSAKQSNTLFTTSELLSILDEVQKENISQSYRAILINEEISHKLELPATEVSLFTRISNMKNFGFEKRQIENIEQVSSDE